MGGKYDYSHMTYEQIESQKIKIFSGEEVMSNSSCFTFLYF